MADEVAKMRALISTEFTVDKIAPEEEEMAFNIIKSLGGVDKVTSFAFAPNHSFNESMGGNLSGFTVKMKRSARASNLLFDSGQFCAGVSVVKLGAHVETTSGVKFTESFIHQSYTSLLDRINKALPDTASDHATSFDMSYFSANSTGADYFTPGKKAWTPALGSNSGWAGVYVSDSSKNTYFTERNYWLAVYSAPQAYSEDAYQKIQALADQGKTVDDLLSRKELTSYAIDASQRNRKRALAKLARALDLDSKFVKYDTDTFAFSQGGEVNHANFEMIHADHETMTNRFFSQPGEDIATFYNNTVDIDRVKSVIFCHNPYAGLTIMQPLAAEKMSAKTGFPMCTGRVKTNRDVKKQLSSKPTLLNDIMSKKDSQHFVFEKESAVAKLKMVPDVFRIRDDKFEKKQKEIAGNREWQPKINLRPLLVKMASWDG